MGGELGVKESAMVNDIGPLKRTASVVPFSSMSNEHPTAMTLALVRAVVYMRLRA